MAIAQPGGGPEVAAGYTRQDQNLVYEDFRNWRRSCHAGFSSAIPITAIGLVEAPNHACERYRFPQLWHSAKLADKATSLDIPIPDQPEGIALQAAFLLAPFLLSSNQRRLGKDVRAHLRFDRSLVRLI